MVHNNIPTLKLIMNTTTSKLFLAALLSLCLSNCGEDETTQPAPAPAPTETTTPAAPAVEKQEPAPAPAPAPEPTPEERYNNGAGAPAEPEAAIAWYTEFAEAGIADASYKLGMCYYNTRSVPMNFVKAAEHLRAAAEQGHPEARAKLAECYEWGVGVEANPEEAAKWKSSETGQ